MTIQEVYRLIDKHYPFRTQYRWDNSGLTANDKPSSEVTGLLLCLDFDHRTLKAAIANGCNLVVCHHPIFKGPSTNKLIRDAKKARVSYIAAHSNFDRSPQGMNKILGAKLGLVNMKQHTDRITMLGTLPKPLTYEQLARLAKRAFNVKTATVYAVRHKPVATIALVGGAGMGHVAEVRNLGVDCFITGDVKWHGYREAHAYGIDVLDVEHYAEQAIIDAMDEMLKKQKVATFKVYPEDNRKVY